MSFTSSQWIWGSQPRKNHFMLFTRTLSVPEETSLIRIHITASYHYELFINGTFINRGPVHGDPQWCNFDSLTYIPDPADTQLHVSIVVRHSSDLYLHYLTPSPAGLRAEFNMGKTIIGTNSQWRCMTLPMWADNVKKRGWALDYIEDYDARLEPDGWSDRTFEQSDTETWEPAVAVPDAQAIWGNYQLRQVPLLRRRFIEPEGMRAWQVPENGPKEPEDITLQFSEEPHTPIGIIKRFNLADLNKLLSTANAFTLELERQVVGFPLIELDASEGTVIEISTAERLEGERPHLDREHWKTSFSVRYTAREGRQIFQPFAWDGFQYIQITVRGNTHGVTFHRIGCVQRFVPLAARHNVITQDALLDAILDICRNTLEISSQELLVDCPTREQSPAWADSLHIAKSLWKGYGEQGYLNWYLEAYIHAPLDEHGQISGRYPTTGRIWLDFTLIPMLGQLFYQNQTGRYYKPDQTINKALQLKEWYNRERNSDGLLEFPFKEYFKKGLRNFIDHPGLGDDEEGHLPYPGIERENISCGLNTFYYIFVRILAHMAALQNHDQAAALRGEALKLEKTILQIFFDGEVFHDAVDNGQLSNGTSWQTNSLAVYAGLTDRDTSTKIMRNMLDGYDRLCRCTPYFHFYFLWALRRAGMEHEAVDVIKKEWGPMIERGSTTTWEHFMDDSVVSLCHPWSTAPFLFLIDPEEFSLPELSITGLS